MKTQPKPMHKIESKNLRKGWIYQNIKFSGYFVPTRMKFIKREGETLLFKQVSKHIDIMFIQRGGYIVFAPTMSFFHSTPH